MPHAVVEFLTEHPDAACVLLVHPHVRVIQRNVQDLAAALGVQPVSVYSAVEIIMAEDAREPPVGHPELAA